MTQYEFDNQKWYKGIQVHINLYNWTGYVAFVDFEKGNIGVSRTTNFYPFEIFKFHEVTVIGKIQPTAIDLIAAEKHELEKEAWYNDGVVIGLRICKELWAQGTISHEQIRENELHYLEELKSVREKIDNLKNKES